MSTIHEHIKDGDAVQLHEIKKEYEYTLDQKFGLMETRDAMRAVRRSVVEISRYINEMSDRLRYLDERRYTICRLPEDVAYMDGINPLYTGPVNVWPVQDFLPIDVDNGVELGGGIERINQLLKAPLKPKKKKRPTGLPRGRPRKTIVDMNELITNVKANARRIEEGLITV